MKHPPKTPDAPIPEIAPPMIKAIEVGATPQTRLPIWKRIIEDRNVYFVLSKVYARPYGSWKPHMVIKKAALYQETSSRLLNCEVIVGMAVAMMVASKPYTKIQRGGRG